MPATWSEPQTAADAWLTDDLVIASTERRREPELAAATIDAALAAPLPTRSALYDVIVIEAAAPYQTTNTLLEVLERLFRERGHRVFRLRADGASVSSGNEKRPTAARGDVGSSAPPFHQRLSGLRRDEAVGAAVLVIAEPSLREDAVRARAAWGWRVVAIASDPSTSAVQRGGVDVTLNPEAIAAAASGPGDDDGATAGDIVASREAAWSTLDRAIRETFPQASIAVLTHDNLAFSRLCLESLLANTEYPNYELLVVDNASTDGTPAYVRELAQRFPWVRPIFNDSNAGFGPGNNQALAAASGEILVLLNNDTMLPRGWLTRFVQHLTDSTLGLIGPATNRTCNEAQIEAPYETYGDFLAFAQRRAIDYDGLRHEIRMPMMFCTAFRRDVLNRVGPLDERFETGMFEDEDYALRVQATGYQVAWAPDVYVHHAYHASIGKLLPSGRYTALFKANQQRFEEKWGICWERHRPAPIPPPAPASTV